MKSDAAKLNKKALAQLLADHWVAMHPAMYAGHEGDAVVYVNHNHPTKADMLLIGSCWGLWS